MYAMLGGGVLDVVKPVCFSMVFTVFASSQASSDPDTLPVLEQKRR